MTKIREFLRIILISIRYFYLVNIYGMHLSKTCRISFGAILDKTNPRGVHVGEDSYVASGAIVFSHDFSRSMKVDTCIGKRCFIGANAIIMPGVRIGDEVIVGSGAVVTKNINSNCIVAGNPAKVIKTGIKTGKYGRLEGLISLN